MPVDMDSVCVKASDPLSKALSLAPYLSHFVANNNAPMLCRRAATFPLSNQCLVKTSSLKDRSLSEPKAMDIQGLDMPPFVACPLNDLLHSRTNDDASAKSRLLCIGERRKKSVSFADDRGRPLATIKIMSEPSDVPPRISSAVLRALGIDCRDSSPDRTSSLSLPKWSWRVEFPQPASDYSKFRSKICGQNVALENVLIDNERGLISGIIKVKNVAFEKHVFVRYSLDDWLTFYDRSAHYLRSAGGDFDTFQFDIDLPPHGDDKCGKILFCICYRAGGIEHWDNNDGRNFELSSDKLRKDIKEENDRRQAAIARCVPGADAFLLSCPNWTEFASWTHLTSDGPYW
uniref:CBM21 domain-containing protein n=1 Tax=Trichuris muris TaxID=70415 RepID=A0A5S6Q049_TRIMR